MKKVCLVASSIVLAFGMFVLPQSAKNVYAEDTSVTDYSYEITPLLEPFNEYFFVKTDNPDPKSFRFADKSSKYSDDSNISLAVDSWENKIYVYEDIDYENEETGRVNGGYIFKSFNTDGGEIILQEKRKYNSWNTAWVDTDVKLELPVLKDDIDYLIDTYATESSFFDNMDAVQKGFSSICLYSGSFIRGELYKKASFWSLSSSPHKDQVFYLQSPYTRKENKSLFASAIYPYRYDSLGFPSVMATVSKRLDSSSSYVWDSNSHAYINVTYQGETKKYGGQGNGQGQGIDEDHVKQRFSFGQNGTKITLEGVKQLLLDYAAIKVTDDVPREDALTWEQVCDRVGSGAWIRLIGINSIYGGSSLKYTYLYKKNEGKNHWAESTGSNGAEIYWGGDLGYASDAWVDGRYVNSWEVYEPGVKFEDHPTSDILLRNVMIPQITYEGRYKYNPDSGKYEYEYTNIQVTEKEKDVVFYYSSDEEKWLADSGVFDQGCASYWRIKDFVEKGLIDERYTDMVTLTSDEVKELEVDRNTDIAIDDYFLYDGTTEPGVAIKEHTHKYKSEVTKQPTCEEDGITTYTCAICGESYTESIARKEHTYGTTGIITKEPTCLEQGIKIYTCSVCQTTKEEVIPAKGHGETEIRNAKEANCVEIGYTGDVCCKDCGEVIEAGENIPKTEEHTWDEGTVTKEATCEEDGVKKYSCILCGEEYTETISAIGHQYVYSEKKATLSEDGRILDKCSVCGDTIIDMVVPRPANIELSSTRYKYDGKIKTPYVEVLGIEGLPVDPSQYDVVFSPGRKEVGTYTVKVIFKGLYSGSLSTSFVIEPDRVMVSSIKISGSSTSIAAGKKVKLTARVYPGNASRKSVKWISSNTKVATVSRDGVVTMNKKSGGKSVTITAIATDGSNAKGVYKIKSMKGYVKKITLSGVKSVTAGKSVVLKAKVSATSGANKKVIWSSGNTRYAKVSSGGKVVTSKFAKGKSVKITASATDGTGKKATVTIKIK